MVSHARSTHHSVAAASSTRAQEVVRTLLGGDANRLQRLAFYPALRQLECRFRRLPRFGEAQHHADEIVYLAQDPSLAFRAAALSSLRDQPGRSAARLAVAFFGLFGPHGPLPLYVTEYAFERKQHHGDRALGAFLDMFHHRLLSLLYRAWASAQPTVSHDRSEDDAFARHLGSLIGLRPSDNGAYSELDYACLSSAVHFLSRTRHAEGLAKTLRAYFHVPVRIDEFVGAWLSIPEQSCWHIPSSAPSELVERAEPLGTLGVSTRLGTEIYDQQSAFSVVLGPLTQAQFEHLLPGGAALSDLATLVERYAGREFAWSVRLVLRESERRAVTLGVEGQLAVTAHIASSDGETLSEYQDLVIDAHNIPR